MIPVQALPLEHDVGNDGKDTQRNALLNDFQLHKVEWPAVAFEANTVGWYLTAILEKGDNPRKEDNTNEGPMVADARLLQTKMPIPSQRHKDVA